mmetsp:Transcript_118708/g.233064  ORF Transcript_118708/g.233064 Transcript_118708/m.233064 type:complete len:301 (-) Transcript_118708:190-1092(-)
MSDGRLVLALRAVDQQRHIPERAPHRAVGWQHDVDHPFAGETLARGGLEESRGVRNADALGNHVLHRYHSHHQCLAGTAQNACHARHGKILWPVLERVAANADEPGGGALMLHQSVLAQPERRGCLFQRVERALEASHCTCPALLDHAGFHVGSLLGDGLTRARQHSCQKARVRILAWRQRGEAAHAVRVDGRAGREHEAGRRRLRVADLGHTRSQRFCHDRLAATITQKLGMLVQQVPFPHFFLALGMALLLIPELERADELQRRLDAAGDRELEPVELGPLGSHIFQSQRRHLRNHGL